MVFDFVIKIKKEHNPPVFQKGYDEGVVSVIRIEYPEATEIDMYNPAFLEELERQADELLVDLFEVEVKTADKS